MQTNNIEWRAFADDVIWIWSNIDETKTAIQIMDNWWKIKKMKINENKSGILRILKRAGKAKIVENKLNIPELTAYKYFEVQISQSLKIDFHNNFIRQKIASIKRNTQTLKSSLINLKSKMTLYKTVIIPQLTNAYHTIYGEEPKGQKITKSGLYQWLKTLLNIKGNVKIENIFKAWNLESNGRPKRKCKLQLDITEFLSINTIKLRADWLFSRYRERSWNCNHLINSKDIIYLWDKLKQ